MGVMLTHEEFIEKFKNKNVHSNTIEIISDYIGSKKPIKFRCLECGKISTTIPNRLLNNNVGCDDCNRKNASKRYAINYTQEEFVSEVYNRNVYADTFMILDNYNTDNIPIRCKCLLCNEEFYENPINLLKDSRCKKHKRKKVNRIKGSVTENVFLERVKQSPKYNTYTIIGKYINSKTPIECQCKICDHIWKTKPESLYIKQSGCPKCAITNRGQNRKSSHEEFLRKFKNFSHHANTIVFHSKYDGLKNTIECECTTCGYQWSAYPRSLLNGIGCKICGYASNSIEHMKSTEQFIKDISIASPNVILKSEYKGKNKYIELECKQCGYSWTTLPDVALNHVFCPACTGRITIKGKTDIATTNPELVTYFANPDEAQKYKAQSNQFIDWKCPDCGYITTKKISSIYYSHNNCVMCSDNLSYPNKFIRNLLKNLPVENVKYEYKPEWASKYYYDSYFEYEGKSYIVEMDGGLGHGNKKYGKNEIDVQGKQRDIIKDDLAKNNNVKIIRIDCFYSNLNYIKDNILKSDLAQIFDLSNIDWNFIDMHSCKNVIKSICEDYLNHIGIDDLSQKYAYSEYTIKKYIQKGKEFNWC